MEWQTVNRKGGGQGLEPWGTGPAHAVDDSYAKFNLSTCPIHLHQASPGEQGSGKGQTLQGPGQGCQSLPRGAQKPQPQARGGKSRTDNGGSKMPEVSQTHTIGQPERSAVRAAANFPRGMSRKPTPSPKSTGPASVKTGGGGSSSGASSGTFLCLSCKRRSRPGRDCQRRKEHTAKEGRVHREMVSNNGQRRPSQRGSRNSVGTAPSCTERPSQPGSETRFSHGKNAQGQSQGAEMRRTTPPGGSFFASCPCRRRRGQLRAEGSTGKCCPQTARTPPGGCSYAIVLRGHKRPRQIC